jgi:multidrug transporter EmrE-like cation transporter
MTLAELFGNANLKFFADGKGHHHLSIGIVSWFVALFFLVESLRSESLMWTCVIWEAMIIIGGALTAYFIFGEKFTHWIQWLGILFALGAAFCINYDKNQVS